MSVDTYVKLVAFDLDDTLAPSKSAIEPAMAQALKQLLERVPVCVISGGQFKQFQKQLLAGLEGTGANLADLHLMPTCGTVYYRFKQGQWQVQYRHDLPESVREETKKVVEATARELGFWCENPRGEIIEDRGTQLTYSALGQEAALADKRRWDPTGEKKIALRQALSVKLPQLQVRAGGSTSVDITARGIDKAYGIGKLVAATGIEKDDLLFVGDRLDPDGNDYPVLVAGYRTKPVTGWEETLEVIEQLLHT
ncbi:MAG: HAD-IIB family hydrolase [Actinomycetaceae bacterium]|nr:HAD-IIB family hydrolase [Actinomycetaceae bacterium]